MLSPLPTYLRTTQELWCFTWDRMTIRRVIPDVESIAGLRWLEMDLSLWVWCDMPVISTFRMFKSKNCEFKANLSYRTVPLKYKEKEAVDKK